MAIELHENLFDPGRRFDSVRTGTHLKTEPKELLELLLGARDLGVDLPPVGELINAAVTLASGRRCKVVLPLATVPVEYSFVRRADQVYISCYELSDAPELFVLDRNITLTELLDGCARAAFRTAEAEPNAATALTLRALGDRASSAEVADVPELEPVIRSGGAMRRPDKTVALVFGFQATLFPQLQSSSDSPAQSDTHALLFPGHLWAYVRGRKISLVRGQILLAVARMVQAVRAMVDAWEEGRSANVRLRSFGFVTGVRLDRDGEVALTLGTEDAGSITVPALDVASAALPILRLASDLLRALVQTDRSQTRNLRVTALRDEVRAIRQSIRTRNRIESIINQDPDRLRWSTLPPNDSAARERTAEPLNQRRLRFSERWRFDTEGLDAAATFFCGDRLVFANPNGISAVKRDSGDVLWSRPHGGGSLLMAGRVLLRRSESGELELRDVSDGETFAHTRLFTRSLEPLRGVAAGGGDVPPVVILADGQSRLVAVDLRTGEPRWRFSARGSSSVRVRRAGRLVIVVSGDNSVHALDVTGGELVWRFVDRTRFITEPAVTRDMAVVVSGEPGRGPATLFGIELFSGKLRWKRNLDGAAMGGPVAAGPITALPIGNSEYASLAAFQPTDGTLRWMVPDPGIASGGATMPVDHSLVVNNPSGLVSAVDLETGVTRWSQMLSHPVTDEVPRRLEPILRGGALFVPAASVQVLKPKDGCVLDGAVPCDLIPDFLRVDERGWVYVGEESGHLRAYAPAPHLEIVRT